MISRQLDDAVTERLRAERRRRERGPQPGDRCGYCHHTRAEHNRPEPGNPAPSLRCGRGCVCAAFIEIDGRHDWQHAQDAAR